MMNAATGSSKATAALLHVEVTLGEDDTLHLSTVGIDIGSATSQIVFSDLTLERRGNRYETTSRAIIYESEVLLTPFISGESLDGPALAAFFEDQYARAGMTSADVDTGTIILTGVALLRHNAELIAEIFAEYFGRFVSVAAGDEIEAMLASYGSGAVAASRDNHAVINVDVGGGTTKLSLCVDGRVEMCAAVNVGARLVAWDHQNVVVRLEPAGVAIARAAKASVALGEVITPEHRKRLAAHMARVVADTAAGEWTSTYVIPLLRTAPLSSDLPSEVILSGGIAHYLDGSESRSFGDLGPDLAAALSTAMAERGIRTRVAPAAMRATVVGASQFTVQVSGTTIHVSDRKVLPLRGVPVSDARGGPGADGTHNLADRVARAIAMTPVDDRAIALSLDWAGSADFTTLDRFCRCVLSGLDASGRKYGALVLAVDHDVAHLIGTHMMEELDYAKPLVVIDGVELEHFDFIDLGDYLPHSASIPVTVKSLTFCNQGATHRAAPAVTADWA